MPAEEMPSDRSAPIGRVLVVDDQEGVRTQLRWGLAERFDVTLARTAQEAGQAIRSHAFDAVILDLGLPPDAEGASEGLRLLQELLAHDPALKVVVLTGNTDHPNALRAVELGAFDYYLKPLKIDELSLILTRACGLARLDRETLGVEASQSPDLLKSGIIGDSVAMRRIFDTVRRVARTDVTVLISGESGTGKELVARAIHAQSPRRLHPFVAINCGAIPENLVESELFGHEKGSFTGAHALRKGRLELADGGTVFLDEIGDLTPAIQVKLLRVLQERQLERVGGRELIPLDVRVLAATNRDIQRLTQEGIFREDLYYRLAVVTIQIPPLRERHDDLRALAAHFLERFAVEYQLRPRPFSTEALQALLAHNWPGNVRELENRIKRAVILAHGRRITAADLDLSGQASPASMITLRAARNDAERRVLTEALRRSQGNISRAAKAIQLSRPAFHELLGKHGIKAEEFKSQGPRRT